MEYKITRTIWILFLLLTASISHAKIKLPAVVSSNMVLQRNTTINLWGWADPHEKISISTSWLDQPLKVEANKYGRWQIVVKTTNSTTPQQIRLVSENSDISLDNILFGEVWVCSGQSNMAQPLSGFEGQPTFGGQKAIMQSANAQLRIFTVNRFGSKRPLDDLEKHISWQEVTPQNLKDFSAVAYFFGKQLQEILQVPVGIIHTSWGGSTVEAWMSEPVLNSHREILLNQSDRAPKFTQRTPSMLFNAMIHPIIPYTIQGVLWYQGESNLQYSKAYKSLFPAMVNDWRTRWGKGNFPFYYVQIAPYLYGSNDYYSPKDNSAYIREAQLHCLDSIPNSGMAVTLDIGSKFSIHPPKKREVADRLLFLALNKTYGYTDIVASAPQYNSYFIEGDAIHLTFKNTQKGFFVSDTLSRFEIAGEDRVFYPAEAKIQKLHTIVVKSAAVPNPIAVRYAWRNWVEGSLLDTNLLPVSSFRTDNWDEATFTND